MSEGYARETTLVRAESNRYDRGLDAALGLCTVGFVLGGLSLARAIPLAESGSSLGFFYLQLLAVVAGGVGVVGLFDYANVVSVTSQRLRGVVFGVLLVLVLLTALAYGTGVTNATLLGAVLLGEAVAIAAAGVASRLEVVDTSPSASAGLLAGSVFVVLGLIFGASIGGSVVGFDSPAWVAVALVVAFALAALTILPREDIGSTLSTAVVVGALGAAIVSAVLGVGWQWNPQSVDGAFTGGTIIPLFVMFGSLLSSWGAAKSRAGFGAQGRQYGAFYIINLNAILMVAVMISIVAFVTIKGAGYAFHGFTIGAGSALVVLLPAIVLSAQFARTPAGTDEWHSGARQAFRVTPLAAVGALTGLVGFVLATGTPFKIPYEYTVQDPLSQKNITLDTAIAVTPDLAIGNLLVVFSGGFLFVYFLRRYGTLRDVGEEYQRLSKLRSGMPAAVLGLLVMTVLFVAVGPEPVGIPLGPTLGLAIAALGSVAAAGLAALPLAGIATGEGPLAERAKARAQLFPVGFLGGLAVMLAVLLFQPAATATPNAGPVDLAPIMGLAGAAAAGTVTLLVARARRGAEGELDRQILAEQIRLGLAGTFGFLALFAFHVTVTGADITLLGVTVGRLGSLSWPMVMAPFIPLVPKPGGILPAVVGTVWLVVGASLFAVPLGVGAAVFLTEYAEQGKFTSLVEVATNALWSTPSIVFGLFGAAFLIPRLGNTESLLSGQLVLGFMLLPLVLITSREAIKSVPDQYRDASAALGVSKWETIKSVVLPAALPGVITGVILGIGRIAGETAPLILVLGSTLNATSAVDVLGGFRFVGQPPFIINDALVQSSAALPTQVWAVISAGVSGSQSQGWGSAFILLVVVLSFYAIGIAARTYFRRKLNYE